MGAPVAFFELTSHDPGKTGRFYTELFGWTISQMPDGGYSLIDTGAGEGAIGGGLGATDGPDDRPGVKIYMRVDDLQAYLGKATKLGGRTLVPPTDLPGGYGKFAMFADLDGNAVGLWA